MNHGNPIDRIKYVVLVSFLALILVSSSGRIAAAEPDSTSTGTAALTPLLSAIMNNVNSLGDVKFSAVDTSSLSPPPTQHYGPYASTSPDSGSCGNDWATDSFSRFFSIFSKDGNIVVVEQFKDWSFVTPAPAGDPAATSMSPGACNNGPYDGGVVNPGITGGAEGYFIIPIPAGIVEISKSPYCNAVTSTNAGCDTTTFMNTHFTACYPAVCQVSTFFNHYSAGGQGLIAHSWVDSSPDRAGETGDIESAVV